VLILNKFVDNSVGLYKFLLNPYNRYCDYSKVDNSESTEHIRAMYPSNNTDRWSEIKYNPDSLTTTNFDSHSLSYTLCDIAVKSLDCCLHNEKVGAALTVSLFLITFRYIAIL